MGNASAVLQAIYQKQLEQGTGSSGNHWNHLRRDALEKRRQRMLNTLMGSQQNRCTLSLVERVRDETRAHTRANKD